ncbi:MAG: alpha/beta hydrolase [Acidimicrobiales bacterium]|nr:alpha/beta hydrolase [Acidimicrobiales bacterium]
MGRVDARYAPVMQIEHDGVSLHIAEDGNPDGPVVLFLHGITGSTDTWDWAVPELAATHRVLRLDFRGHGLSGHAPGTYGFPAWVRDATAACEQVAGGPAVLVGHSLGGGVAAAIAQARPELARAVLLEDPAIMSGGLEVDAGEPNALLAVFAMMRESIPMLQASGVTPDALVGILNESPALDGRLFKDSLHADAINAMATAMLRLDASVLDGVLAGELDLVYDGHAGMIVPGIVLAGDEASPDTIVRAPEKKLLAESSPKIDVRVVAGAGHLIHDSLEHREAMRLAMHEVVGMH